MREKLEREKKSKHSEFWAEAGNRKDMGYFIFVLHESSVPKSKGSLSVYRKHAKFCNSVAFHITTVIWRWNKIQRFESEISCYSAKCAPLGIDFLRLCY